MFLHLQFGNSVVFQCVHVGSSSRVFTMIFRNTPDREQFPFFLLLYFTHYRMRKTFQTYPVCRDMSIALKMSLFDAALQLSLAIWDIAYYIYTKCTFVGKNIITLFDIEWLPFGNKAEIIKFSVFTAYCLVNSLI